MNYFTYNKVVLNSSFGYSAALAVLLLALIVICSAALLYLRLRHDAGPAASDDAPGGSPAEPRALSRHDADRGEA